ncbi:MAG: hypothetical protein AB7P04_09445 [Bacteriovoracia bacterium]
MSQKRFWFSVFAVWVVMMVTNFLFHGIWLSPMYQATAQLWRPMEEMQKMMAFMWLGDFIFSWAFVWIYSKGISKDNPWHQAFRYGLGILIVAHLPGQLGMWVTTPVPTELVMRWFFVSVVQVLCASFIMTWTFKPMQAWQKAHART